MPRATPLPDSPRTIDAFAVVALLAGLAQSTLAMFTEHRLQGAISLGLLVVAAAAYVSGRVGGERSRTAVVITACTALAWALVATPLMLLPLVLGLVLVRLDLGVRSALLAAALALVVGAVVLLGDETTGLGYVIQEAFGLALILYGIVWLAGIIADSYQSQHHSELVSAERDRALIDLEAAHEALAASVETEKDLVLAEERARAAGELHDGLGHRLTAIRLGLEFADRVWERDPAAAREEVRGARDATVEALQEMRVWVRALSPQPQARLGDAASFEAIADTFRGTGLTVRVTTDGLDAALTPEWSLFAHRLIQEGLTNAVRHGAASAVDIVVERDEHGLRIAVEDNGTGAVLDDVAAPPEGFGLRSIRERAERLGGTVTAGGQDAGFRLEATLPAKVLAS